MMVAAGGKKARQRTGGAGKGTPGKKLPEGSTDAIRHTRGSTAQPAGEGAQPPEKRGRGRPRKAANATSAADTGSGAHTKPVPPDKRIQTRAMGAASTSKNKQQPSTAMAAVSREVAAKKQHTPSSTNAMRTRRASAARLTEPLAVGAAAKTQPAKSDGAKEAEASQCILKKRAHPRSRSPLRASVKDKSEMVLKSAQPGEMARSNGSDDAAKAVPKGRRDRCSSHFGQAEEPFHTAAAEEQVGKKRGRPPKNGECAEDTATEQTQAAQGNGQQLEAGQPAAEPAVAGTRAAKRAATLSGPSPKRRRTGHSVAQFQGAAAAEGVQSSAEQKAAKGPLQQKRQACATKASELASNEAVQGKPQELAAFDKRHSMIRGDAENAYPGLDLPSKSPVPSNRGARVPLSPSQYALASGVTAGLQPPCPADAAEARAALAIEPAADCESKAVFPFPQLAGPPSPQDPAWFDPTDPIKVHAVEAALHVSQASAGSLPLCRDSQAQELLRLLQLHISSSQGGSVYVSGLPGTGKSLTVHEVARQCWAAATTSQGLGSPTIASINCMSLQQPSAIFRRALEAFQQGKATAKGDPIIYSGGAASAGHEDALAALKDFVQQPPQATPVMKGRQHSMLVLLLDEMDQLMSQSRSVLYKLFALPQLPRSKLILLGISNSIDMADRTLPHLRELGSHPHAVPFPSYSAQQMGEIIRQRLSSLPGPVFQEQAITFCARKMAAASGDMRRALEACASALKILVADACTPAAPDDDSQEPEGTEGPAASVAAPKRRLVGLGDMAEAVSSLQGGAGEASAVVQAMRSLPQQQQLVLCTAAKLLGQADQAEPAPPGGRAPGTPSAKSKVQRQRSGSLLSPSQPRTPSGKCRQPGTPAKAPGSVSRSGLLGTAQECSLGLLHESYAQLCKQVAMKPLSSIEFTAACSTLADMGIMEVGKAREERQRRVSLRTHKDDVALALKDVRLLRNFLSL